MQFYDHLIDQRSSLFWNTGNNERNELSGIQIEQAGVTIRHWRNCRKHDKDAIDGTNAELRALRTQEAATLKNLLALHRITVCIIHDQEHQASKNDLRKSFDEATKLLGNRPFCVGELGCWLIAVVPGDDNFVSNTCDTFDLTEKPSEVIPQTVTRGDCFRFLGTASDGHTAVDLLDD